MRRFIRNAAKATVAALATALIVACDDGASEQTGHANADEHWRVVQAYLTLDTAWHDGDLDRGPHPDITLAVAAAKRVIAELDHPQRIAAAEFLAEHPQGLSKTAEDDMALGRKTLQARLGPDWAVVESYTADLQRWQAADDAIDAADLSADERRSRRKALGRRPAAHRAVAAATAVMAVADHPRQEDAAKFLVLESGRGAHVVDAARTLFANSPGFLDWPDALWAVDQSLFGSNEQIELFFADVSASAPDAAVRAAARFYLAARFTQAANELGANAAERDAKRERALELAIGLSEGVADLEFAGAREYSDDGTPLTGTFAQAEADLVYRIEHVTAGGTLAEATGKRLDGVEETLQAYAGKVVLIDFWATWCGPCVGALPTLRELHAKMPADRFALLSISIDDELETVADFQEDEPMPWENWHIGDKSKLAAAWAVSVYPTYILVNERGTILARTNELADSLLALIEDTVDSNATS